jgi:hypothetical protein
MDVLHLLHGWMGNPPPRENEKYSKDLLKFAYDITVFDGSDE